MNYYESYFDEDLDEALTEDHDELFEDYDEAEEFGEDRAGRRRRRQQRRNARQQRRQDRRDRRHGSKSPGAAASTGAVREAFDNVGQDMAKYKSELKKAETRQSNEQMIDLLKTVLLRSKLVTATPVIYKGDAEVQEMKVFLKDSTGNIIKDPQIGYGLEDNLLPQLAASLLSQVKGISDAKDGFTPYVPLAIATAISPTAQESLGLRSQPGTSNKNSSPLDGILKNPNLLLILALAFLPRLLRKI